MQITHLYTCSASTHWVTGKETLLTFSKIRILYKKIIRCNRFMSFGSTLMPKKVKDRYFYRYTHCYN